MPTGFSYLGIPAGDCEITIEKFFSRVIPTNGYACRCFAKTVIRKRNTRFILLSAATGRWKLGVVSEQSMYLSKTNDGSPYRIVGAWP